MAAAAQLVAALPLDSHCDEPPLRGHSTANVEECPELEAAACCLLGMLCQTARDNPCLDAAQRRRLAPQLLRVLARFEPLLRALLAKSGGQYIRLAPTQYAFLDLMVTFQVGAVWCEARGVARRAGCILSSSSADRPSRGTHSESFFCPPTLAFAVVGGC